MSQLRNPGINPETSLATKVDTLGPTTRRREVQETGEVDTMMITLIHLVYLPISLFPVEIVLLATSARHQIGPRSLAMGKA